MTREQIVVTFLLAAVSGLLAYWFALEVWCWAYGLIY